MWHVHFENHDLCAVRAPSPAPHSHVPVEPFVRLKMITILLCLPSDKCVGSMGFNVDHSLTFPESKLLEENQKRSRHNLKRRGNLCTKSSSSALSSSSGLTSFYLLTCCPFACTYPGTYFGPFCWPTTGDLSTQLSSDAPQRRPAQDRDV